MFDGMIIVGVDYAVANTGSWTVTFPPALKSTIRLPDPPPPHSTRVRHRQLKRARRRVERERQRGIL